jgi:ABC-type Fe3+-hydroxamate transport system substrate-binding protein
MVGVFVCGVLLLLGACGREAPTRAEVAVNRPITVVDDDGRTVALPRAPHRIISLVPSATETIVALGAGDRLVGRTRYDRGSSIAGLPVVGGGLDPNLETIVGLAPELVVTWSSDKRAETRHRLDAAGIPTLNLSLQDTTDAFRAVALLGDALPGKASEVASSQETCPPAPGAPFEGKGRGLFVSTWPTNPHLSPFGCTNGGLMRRERPAWP